LIRSLLSGGTLSRRFFIALAAQQPVKQSWKAVQMTQGDPRVAILRFIRKKTKVPILRVPISLSERRFVSGGRRWQVTQRSNLAISLGSRPLMPP
jgi:hypothetical protein